MIERLTFLDMVSSWWKQDASTMLHNSSSPFSVALPILLIGVNLLIQRLLLLLEDARASEQILCTKDTGSIGSRVLKNKTFDCHQTGILA